MHHSNSKYLETIEVYKDTGWPRPIGGLKLQVIFRKRATNHRALLREMACKDKASYGSSPPCNRDRSRGARDI